MAVSVVSEPAPALGKTVKENIILEFFKTDYELSKIHVLKHAPVHILHSKS